MHPKGFGCGMTILLVFRPTFFNEFFDHDQSWICCRCGCELLLRRRSNRYTVKNAYPTEVHLLKCTRDKCSFVGYRLALTLVCLLTNNTLKCLLIISVRHIYEIFCFNSRASPQALFNLSQDKLVGILSVQPSAI